MIFVRGGCFGFLGWVEWLQKQVVTNSGESKDQAHTAMILLQGRAFFESLALQAAAIVLVLGVRWISLPRAVVKGGRPTAGAALQPFAELTVH